LKICNFFDNHHLENTCFTDLCQQANPQPLLDHLSEADKQKYKENVHTIETIQMDLQEKENKSKDNPKLYERLIPDLIRSVTELEIENQHILESKVHLFSFK
jgi:glucose-6-phosphate 1-dehydrogenase